MFRFGLKRVFSVGGVQLSLAEMFCCNQFFLHGPHSLIPSCNFSISLFEMESLPVQNSLSSVQGSCFFVCLLSLFFCTSALLERGRALSTKLLIFKPKINELALKYIVISGL